jgi:hypothetical protein
MAVAYEKTVMGKGDSIVKQKVKICLSLAYAGVFLIFAAITVLQSHAAGIDDDILTVHAGIEQVEEFTVD